MDTPFGEKHPQDHQPNQNSPVKMTSYRTEARQAPVECAVAGDHKQGVDKRAQEHHQVSEARSGASNNRRVRQEHRAVSMSRLNTAS